MKTKRFVALLVAVPLAAGGLSASVAWAGAAAPAKAKAKAPAKVKPYKTYRVGGHRGQCNKSDVAV